MFERQNLSINSAVIKVMALAAAVLISYPRMRTTMKIPLAAVLAAA